MKRLNWIVTVLLVVGLLPLGMVQAQDGTLSYGDTVSGTITDDDPIQAWTFEGADGDVVDITMQATEQGNDGLDSFVQLLDPSGEVIAENDDASNTTVDAAIENFPLTESGTYTINATRFGLENGVATGGYELTLNLAEDEPAPPPDDPQTDPFEPQSIGYNSPVTGSLDDQVFAQFWVFEGSEGDQITIHMERQSGDLDTFLILLDENEEELDFNDDAPDTDVSEIADFELPTSGNYFIIATRYGFDEGTTRGEYSLEIILGDDEPVVVENEPPPAQTPTFPAFDIAEATATVYGQFTTGLIESTDQADVYSFEGKLGDIVVISVKRASGELDPDVALLDSNQNVLIRNETFNGPADARIAGFVLPADGVYYIVVYSHSEAEGEYVLHVFAAKTVSNAAIAQSNPTVVETVTTTTPSGAAGALSVTLAWSGTADFDLAMLDTNGDQIDYENTSAPSGAIFGGDANGACEVVTPDPSETIYWESDAPLGEYTIGVGYVLPCDENGNNPISFSVTVTYNGAVIASFDGEMTEGDFESYSFTLE